MPRPLIVAFGILAAAAVTLIVVLMVRPPSPNDLPVAERRSEPTATLSHDTVEAQLVDVPDQLPPFTPPCEEVRGVVVEGGQPAHERIGDVLRMLCPYARAGAPADVQSAVRALGRARIRFALFTRTGDLSTIDLSANRIQLAVALSRTNVPPVIIGPLLVHEAVHLVAGRPVTAGQEYAARVAELAACRLLIEVDRFPRGCLDAQELVSLGAQRAIAELIESGFPR